MILDSNFALRREDVETHFRCLDFITSVESHRQIPILDPSTSHQLNVDLQMQCCLKAQTLILLYNMVESTTCECLNFIYDTVADEGLLYSDLTDKMRRMWTSSYKRAGREEHKWGEGLHPWDSQGKNTGVGCHCLLQCMNVKSESEVMSDSLRAHGLQHATSPCPSPTPRVYSNSCPLSW